MMIMSNMKGILLLKFSSNSILRYTTLEKCKEDIARLLLEGCCIEHKNSYGILIYEWIKKEPNSNTNSSENFFLGFDHLGNCSKSIMCV